MADKNSDKQVHPSWFERRWFKHFEHLAILLALFAVIFDVAWRFGVDRPHLVEDAVVRKATLDEIAADHDLRVLTLKELRAANIERSKAWLYDATMPNNLRMEGLKNLLDDGALLEHFDLSCETIGGRWQDSYFKKCLGGITFEEFVWAGTHDEKFRSDGVQLSGAEFENSIIAFGKLLNADLESTSWQNATSIKNMEFVGGSFARARFGSSQITGTKFTKSDLEKVQFALTDLKGVRFFQSNLSGTKFAGGSMADVQFFGSHVSHLQICSDGEACPDGYETLSFRTSWAWADRPPFLPEGLRYDGYLCDPSQRTDVNRGSIVPKNTVRPKVCSLAE